MKKSLQAAQIEPVLLPSYLSFIEASLGSRQFRHLYCRVNGKTRDILKDGELSCAFFVSTVLVTFGLLQEMHATVTGTVKDMKTAGWRQIPRPRTGSIIVWGAVKFPDGQLHRHIGFYAGKGRSISNDYRRKSPAIKPWRYRPIESLWWHPRLEGK